MKFNEELIKKLTNGEVAVKVNLKKVLPSDVNKLLKTSFPNDETLIEDIDPPNISYYHMSRYIKSEWAYDEIQYVKEQGFKLVCFADFLLKENCDFHTILNSIGEMLEAKDKAYGNSALKPLEIFAKHHPYGSRLDEKLARVKNSEDLKKNDVADLIGGLVLICRDKGWTDFSDQID